MSNGFKLNEEMYSFEQATQRFEAFESFLLENGIRIKPESELERLCLSIYDVLYKHNVPASQDPNADIRPLLRDILGMNALIHKILKVKDCPTVKTIVAHLDLLNQGNPLQNVLTPVTDQASNKIFELLIACAFMIHATDVELEDPYVSKGDNPDVLGSLCDYRFGIACKVAHALKGKTIFDTIEKGVNQIERSPAEVGVVIINVKNIINHDNYWTITNQQEWKSGAEPLFSGYKDYKYARDLLIQEVNSIADIVFEAVAANDLKELFNGKKSIPVLLFFVSTAIGTVIGGKPLPSSLGFLRMFTIDSISSNESRLIKLLNDGLQYRPRLTIPSNKT